MCGIVGIRRFDGRPIDEAMLRAMAARLHHRGPDGDGFRIWKDIGFGHTRLSIIDLNTGWQPRHEPAHGLLHASIGILDEIR